MGRPAAAFFDLDKTIIATSSTLAFGRQFYANGLITRSAMLKGAYAQLVYLLGGVDEAQMERLRDDLARQVTGWDVSQVQQIVDETLHELITPLVYAEAAELIESHHAAGRDVVIVSSSGVEVVTPIADLLGADHVIATRMVVADGRYTGEIAFYAAGPHKATAIRELALAQGYELSRCFAYSDSATDLPMLESVGNPVAVNPDRQLRRMALARGWDVVNFRHPVPLRSRMGRLTPRRAPIALGVGGALALGALAWRRTRRPPQPARAVVERSPNSGLGKAAPRR